MFKSEKGKNTSCPQLFKRIRVSQFGCVETTGSQYPLGSSSIGYHDFVWGVAFTSSVTFSVWLWMMRKRTRSVVFCWNRIQDAWLYVGWISWVGDWLPKIWMSIIKMLLNVTLTLVLFSLCECVHDWWACLCVSVMIYCYCGEWSVIHWKPRVPGLQLCFVLFSSSFRPITQAPKPHYATACMESDLHIVFPHPCS